MRSNSLTTLLFAIYAFHGVFGVPLGIQHGEATTDEETANLGRLTAATAEANNHITKMETALNDPTNAKHKPLIDAAFGTDPSLDLNHIKANVQKLKTGTVPVTLHNSGNSKTMAYTQYNDHMVPQHVDFGKKFHTSALSTQAGTLIHEATHHLGDTGDYIKDGKMLKGSHPDETDRSGYAGKQSFYKTTKSLNGDKIWTNMRDGHTDKDGVVHAATKNMHDNAESYAQFASLCNAALRRRDLHMYRRALAEGQDEIASFYLQRRSSCALPKNHFANKAAAKKAAEAKTKAPGAKTAGSKLTTPKNAKAAAGAKTLLSKTRAGAAKSSKVGAVKHLANGRVAKAATKVAGSRRPASRVAAGKHTIAKGGAAIKHASRPGATANKHAATANKHTTKPAAGSKHIAHPAANKHSAKPAQRVARPAGNKHTAKPAQRVARPAANKHTAKPAQRVARPAANKHTNKPAPHANAATRHTAKPAAANHNKPVARPAAHQAKPLPRPAAKFASKPAAPKKGRRELDFELEY